LVVSPSNHMVLVTAKHVIIGPDGNFNPNLAWRLNERTNVADLIKDSDQQVQLGGGLRRQIPILHVVSCHTATVLTSQLFQ
jgi:hypothetical protein